MVTPKHLKDLAKRQRAGYLLDSARELRLRRLREAIVDQRRIDILAKYVLGVTLQPHQLRMLQHQDEHDEALILGWRGCGKTTGCTTARAIGEILANPNVRILIVSDAAEQAKMFLRAVRLAFERNELLRETFGDWVTGSPRWSSEELVVAARTVESLEPTLMAAGTDTVLPSRHFDIILADDLVTRDSASTPGQRRKTADYYYQTLLPCLASPGGRLWLMGTRWDEEDLYGWLQGEDMAESTLVVPALDPATDLSVWEDQFPTRKLHRLRKANLRAFELQYVLRPGTLLGGIFGADHFAWYDGAPPHDCFWWQGVDPAVTQRDKGCDFAHVTVALGKTTKRPWLVDYYEGKLPFPRQVDLIRERFEMHSEHVVRVVAESNGFQLALSQQIAEQCPEVPIIPERTAEDKIARANQLAGIMGAGGIHVRREHEGFVRRLCGLRESQPKNRGWDLFDAFDIAIRRGLRGARKKTRWQEPGLI